MASPPTGALPPGDRQRFSDPAAEPVYAAIKSLDLASQHQMLRALHVKLHAEDDALARLRDASARAVDGSS
jgi:hypothetical protein